MPSIRITPNKEMLEEQAKFKQHLKDVGILQLIKDAETALKDRFMEDDVPEDPMKFVMQKLGVKLADPKEIVAIKEEIAKVYEEIRKYDPRNRVLSIATEDNKSINSALDDMSTNEFDISDFQANKFKTVINFEEPVPNSSSNPGAVKSDNQNMLNSQRSMKEIQEAERIRASLVTNRPSAKSKDLDRAPIIGCQVMESKREACRQMMESNGILQAFERALFALFTAKEPPEDPMKFFLEDLRIHSKENQELEALKNELQIIQLRLESLKNEAKKLEQEKKPEETKGRFSKK